MKKGRRIIIITGVSCSWKTTLQNELLERGWNRPLNYTTRKPRDKEALVSIDAEGDFNSKELDEYIFLSENNFFNKLKNWDFLENTNYNWNYYWVGRVWMPKWNIAIVLDPAWRSQVLEYYTKRGIEVETYYMDITKELQEERLIKRGDDEKQIIARKRDFKWFSATNKCIRLNWKEDPDILANLIEH